MPRVKWDEEATGYLLEAIEKANTLDGILGRKNGRTPKGWWEAVASLAIVASYGKIPFSAEACRVRHHRILAQRAEEARAAAEEAASVETETPGGELELIHQELVRLNERLTNIEDALTS